MSGLERGHTGTDLRESGRLQVLDAIRHAEQLARIDISKVTGLSPATVTAITAELLRAGLIEEILPDAKPQGARRGRPRVTLKLRGASRHVAGLKVSKRSITVLILDFEGHDIVDVERALPAESLTAAQLRDHILAAVSDACAEAGLALSELSGIGIGLAGQVGIDQSFVHWSSSLNERNVDLGGMLSERANCPVFLDNDANLVAKAEHLFGEGRHFDNFLVVTMEYGVGIGIVIDGELYRGSRGCGAEFGHTKVQMEGALCQCGQRGCLEAYIGHYALLREFNSVTGDGPFADINRLFEAVEAGNPVAESVVERAGRMFAMGLANLMNLFDPQLIILSGHHAARHPLFEDRVIEEARRLVVQVDAPDPLVRVHGWHDLMWAKGAAAHAIEQVTAISVRDLGRLEPEVDAV